ncbi:diguanylate cyclase [Vibrio fluvialis]|uniref:Diguanylate cyclase n=1 Tax=Vibrio fluvialis TaxID=676 RepID=A0AAX2LS88_VIBFL|nr:GGDEF domain-containing protein [Vibrio fluvialis]SUP30841.1 diguanylate cyclase [Vibrio fluvialis]
MIDSCNQLPTLHGSLFLIGIDKFRDINDSLGHHQADQLLVLIAQRLKTVSHDNSYIARIGGDEFAIYLPQCDDIRPSSSLPNSCCNCSPRIQYAE